MKRFALCLMLIFFFCQDALSNTFNPTFRDITVGESTYEWVKSRIESFDSAYDRLSVFSDFFIQSSTKINGIKTDVNFFFYNKKLVRIEFLLEDHKLKREIKDYLTLEFGNKHSYGTYIYENIKQDWVHFCDAWAGGSNFKNSACDDAAVILKGSNFGYQSFSYGVINSGFLSKKPFSPVILIYQDPAQSTLFNSYHSKIKSNKSQENRRKLHEEIKRDM